MVSSVVKACKNCTHARPHVDKNQIGRTQYICKALPPVATPIPTMTPRGPATEIRFMNPVMAPDEECDLFDPPEPSAHNG